MLDLKKYSSEAKLLALKMSGHVGPRTFQLLWHNYKSLDNILLAEEDELMEIENIGQNRAAAIFRADQNLDKASAQLRDLEKAEIKVVTCLDDNYPSRLQELNDPPLMLYYRGRLPARTEKTVAIIGSKDVSAEGIGDAMELSNRLAQEDVSIISGLARGIDTAGHIGALKSQGHTYAVLPSGFSKIYPVENRAITEEMIERGGLISEYLPDTPTTSGRLMSRNRIIVGLAQAVIIGEMAESSVGTLDAALCCKELGKLMFVLVGKNNHHYEKLAEYGAIPLTNIDEYEMILKALV